MKKMETTSDDKRTRGKRELRPTQIGLVTSDKGDKTIRVQVNFSTRHPLYGKYLRRRTVLHAHDQSNQAKVGDRVEVMACRPLSKTKRWRLVRVVQAGAVAR